MLSGNRSSSLEGARGGGSACLPAHPQLRRHVTTLTVTDVAYDLEVLALMVQQHALSLQQLHTVHLEVLPCGFFSALCTYRSLIHMVNS